MSIYTTGTHISGFDFSGRQRTGVVVSVYTPGGYYIIRVANGDNAAVRMETAEGKDTPHGDNSDRRGDHERGGARNAHDHGAAGTKAAGAAGAETRGEEKMTVRELCDRLQPGEEWSGAVDGRDLHALFEALTGDPSPRGRVRLDPAAIRRIAEDGSGHPEMCEGSAQQAAQDLIAAGIV